MLSVKHLMPSRAAITARRAQANPASNEGALRTAPQQRGQVRESGAGGEGAPVTVGELVE